MHHWEHLHGVPLRAARQMEPAALLVAPWMGLVPLNHPGLQATVDRAHHWHGGGVLLHGGAHTAATALYAGVCSLLEPVRCSGNGGPSGFWYV